mgnify:CR=1 FL=1
MNVFELFVALRVIGPRYLLAVDAESVVQVREQASDGRVRHRDARLGQLRAECAGRLATPLDPGDRVSRRVGFEQRVEGGDHIGRFFSTRTRPPPAVRTRSRSTSCAANSRRSSWLRPVTTTCRSGRRPFRVATTSSSGR